MLCALIKNPDAAVRLASGMTGQYLLDRSRRDLSAKRTAYEADGLSDRVADQEVFWDAVTVDLMKQWRSVHFPITLAFGVLGLAHILSIFLFWQWK